MIFISRVSGLGLDRPHALWPRSALASLSLESASAWCQAGLINIPEGGSHQKTFLGHMFICAVFDTKPTCNH